MGNCGKDPEWSGEWGTPELRDWGYGKSRGFITRRIQGMSGSETQQSYNRNHSVLLMLFTGLAKKFIQVCPSRPTEKAKWPFGQPNTGLPNSVWTSSKAERRSSNEFSHVQGSVLHWEGPKGKADKDLKEWESRVKGEVQRRRKTCREWTQSQTRWEGRWTVVRGLGKTLPTSWILTEIGLGTEGQVEKGSRGGENKQRKARGNHSSILLQHGDTTKHTTIGRKQ